MKFLFNALLFVFTAVSAYVTYTLTSSLANNIHENIAFSSLGVAFDVLKCFLPAAILAAGFRNWGKALILISVYLGLTAWSFYASTELFAVSANRKIEERVKSTVVYKNLDQEMANYQSSYDELKALQRITQANTTYNPLMQAVAAKQAALIADAIANKVQSKKDFYMTIVVSFLLEFSVLACHIAKVLLSANSHKTAVKESKNQGKNDAVSDAAADSREQAAAEFVEDLAANTAAKNDSIADSRETILKLSVNELAALLKSNKDDALSYSKITAKYGVKNKDTIRDAKQILTAEAQELEQAKADEAKSMLKNDIPESNIILLPNYK